MLQFGNELVKSSLDFINFSSKKNILQKRIYVSLNPTGVLHIKTVETCHQGRNILSNHIIGFPINNSPAACMHFWRKLCWTAIHWFTLSSQNYRITLFISKRVLNFVSQLTIPGFLKLRNSLPFIPLCIILIFSRICYSVPVESLQI